MNHRVKITLMTVQSLVSQTLRSSPDPVAFKHFFETRLVALSRAHDLLERGQWKGVELRDLITRNPAPFAEPDRIGMTGPTVRLGPEATVSLGLAFNELTLNALTVGALAGIDGHLSVTWETADSGDGRGPCLHLDWVERHDRMRGIPTRRGFGRRFLENALMRQLDGGVTLALGPDGVHCHLDLRLAALHPRRSGHESPGRGWLLPGHERRVHWTHPGRERRR
nr:sensor histidine kinase [Methylobacterium sp. J-059]